MYIALNEVYFGKSKNLLECEKLVKELKDKYDGKYLDGGRIEFETSHKDLCKRLAQEFGLKRFWMSYLSTPIANASTPPISWAIECMPTCRMKANLIVDKAGFKYRPEAGYILHMDMYTGLFCNPNYTAGEIMAVILHEIGHNFQAVIDNTCFMLNDVTQWSKILYTMLFYISHGHIEGAISMALLPIVYSNFAKDLDDRITEMLSQYEAIKFLVYIINLAEGVGTTIRMQLNYAMAALLGYVRAINPASYISGVIQGLVKTALDPLGYRHERVADNFATAYGYGPELASGLLKLDTINYEELPINKLANFVSPVGIFLRTGVGLSSMIGGMFDPHPETMERCLDQIRYLRKELDYVHDKETRAIIKNQIDTIDANLSAIMKDPQLLEHWNIVSYIIAYTVYHSDGDIRHNIMGRDIHANMQRTYDENIDKKKFKKPRLI